MTDKQFLNWVADRFVFVYGESPKVDYVQKLRAMADAAPGLALPVTPKSTGLKAAAGVFSVVVVVLLVWGALSV